MSDPALDPFPREETIVTATDPRDVAAEQVVDYARRVLGVELHPWQVQAVARALAGEVFTWSHRGGRRTLARAVEDFRAEADADGEG